MHPKTTLYRAPYIVPVDTPVIENGAILTSQGKIVAVDRFSRLRAEADLVVDCEACVITPALINCHAHLELSYMAETGQDNSFFEPGDIPSWIRGLLAKRAAASTPASEVWEAAVSALAALHDSGVAMVADIGNLAESRGFAEGSLVEVEFFLEIMGVSRQASQAAQERLPLTGFSCTAHSPYADHRDLLIYLKELARQQQTLFPLHVAEPADELELLKFGAGRFQLFLEMLD